MAMTSADAQGVPSPSPSPSPLRMLGSLEDTKELLNVNAKAKTNANVRHQSASRVRSRFAPSWKRGYHAN